MGAHRVQNERQSVSQSVSYFTVPPRAHPSTGSQSGSATPGLTQVPSAVTAVYTDIMKSAVRAGSFKRYMNARQEFLAFHISGQVGNLSTCT